MLTTALLCLAGALAMVPARPLATRRARGLVAAAEPGPGEPGPAGRGPAGRGPAGRGPAAEAGGPWRASRRAGSVAVTAGCSRPVVAGAVAGATVLSHLVAGLGAAVVTAVGCGSVLVALCRGRRHRVDEREAQAAVELLALVSTELSAGASPDQAFAAAATVGRGALAPACGTAAAVWRLGGSAAPIFTAVALDGAAGARGAARRVATCVWISETTGAALGRLLERAEVAVRGELHHQRQVTAALAGFRASTALLTALPPLGLGLGAAAGTQPLHALTRSPAGTVVLLAGAGLTVAGAVISAALVRLAGRQL